MFYMKQAILQAKKALKYDEVPIGAVLVDSKTGKIMAKAYNKVEKCDATCHAEILAMKKACKKLKQNRLRDHDLYVTLEPCAMCAGAISLMRIRNLYFATEDKKGGAIINGVRFFEQKTCHHKPNVNVGLCQEEASTLLKDFFKTKRNK